LFNDESHYARQTLKYLCSIKSNIMKKIYLSLALLGLLNVNAQQTFSNFQAASLVIGQPNFITNNVSVDAFTGVASSCSDLSSKGQFAVGSQNGRIFLYNNLPSVNGASASIVLGKPDFTSTTLGCTQSLCNSINGVIFTPDGKKLIASDWGNNRVLIWNSIPTTNGQNADVVIGQTSFTTSSSGTSASKFWRPQELAISPDGRLLIADRYNNRVLVFNTIPTTNGASADVVIGQSTFTTSTTGNFANQMNQPWGVSVSSTGKLAIADEQNNRVLIFNSIPTTNNASANTVLGQTGFSLSVAATSQSGMSSPLGVSFSPEGKLAVSDFVNHRILIYNMIPTSNGANADIVLGQPTFTVNTSFNGGITAQSMSEPYGLNFDLNGRLFVNGRNMNRTMVFGSVPTQTAELAVSISASSASLCAGSEISIDVTVQNNGSSAASNVIATTALPYYFNLLGSIASAGVYANGYWTIPSIASGSSVMLTLTGTVNTSVAQVIPAYCNILNSQQYDSNLLNNGTSATLNISSGTPPSIGSISGPTVVCAGSTNAYAVNGVTNVTTYNWSASNATVASTAVSANVVFGTGSTSNINVLPANANCTGTKMTFAVSVSPCTGLNGNSLENVVARVYPNPSNGVITVESINSIESVEVIDLNGRTVLTENNVNNSNITMNVGSLTNSVYLLRVKLATGEVANSRIVVQK